MITEKEQSSLFLDQGTYLGPARVRCVAGNRVQLEFPDESPWALLALAYPYQPVAGDIVLAAGQGENWYVIGILQGSGKTTLMVPADLELLAPRGRINLLAGKGVQIKSPEVEITAGKLELAARRVMEHFTEATRWVRDTWQVRAGRMRIQVEDDYRLKAGRINERADKDVKIDGEKIHLG